MHGPTRIFWANLTSFSLQLGRFLAASVAHNITWDFDMRHLTAHPALLKQQVPDS